MKLALLALLTFAAPALPAEAFSSVEEEVLVQSSKSAVRAVPAKEPSRRAVVSPVRPASPRPVEELPTRSLTDWTPTVFTRPPPLS